MSFSDDMKRIQIELEARVLRVFDAQVLHAHRSIVEGSEVTGASGQPVKFGTLRASYQVTKESRTRASITTNLPYAEGIELGEGPHGPLTLRSPVGGFHSIEKTVTGMQAIVDYETAQVGR